uniref:Uncharacterized protein n=1 Tax=Tanacetum cinerariifolium TaxID=118510 RepID=A0A699W8V1_TANCI|nr:hypothetical protein [Tanacetum cinerariifolium]
MSKKQKREYYMAVIKSYLGWRFKDFKDYKIGWQHCLLLILCRSSKAARYGGSESAIGSSERVSQHQTSIK